ncbi:serine/threonine protein phosphatase [Mycolicibacterium agri]|uniref:Serine/threonine protein phosphatase n=1 Tax=Mycolicibacterium agri TaxID=36811 RepID=A0A2A7NDH2_MYCAG|nr:serine/threonine protein phosphatase [Mycolicibacterium agri]
MPRATPSGSTSDTRLNWRSLAALFASVALAYAAGATLSWQSFGAHVTPAFFPPAGVTLALMLLTPRPRWAVIVAAIVTAELAVDLYFGVGVATALGFATANSVEAIVGASVVSAWCGGVPDLRTRRGLGKFLVGACLAGPIVGGLIGGTVSSLQNSAPWLTTALHWWAGDAIGVLVVGAPILLWTKQSYVLRNRPVESAAVLAVTAVLSLVAIMWQAPLTLPLLPVMVWAALRLDVIGAALAGAVVAFTVNYMTGTGRAAFRLFGLAEAGRLVTTQIFVAVMVLVAMLIAQEAAGRVAALRASEAERRERDRLQTLAQLAQVLSAALTPSQIGDAVVKQLYTDAGAQAVALGLVTADGRRLEWVKTAGYPQLVQDKFGPSVSLDDLSASTEAVRTGRPVVIGSAAEYRRRYSQNADLMARTGAESLVNWPLISGTKPIGVLAMMWTQPQALDAAQLAYISAVATMVTQGLVRAQMYADEHARAAVLQAAVLPSEPADVADLEVTVTYEPADDEHGLGGDWYDVMALPKGRTYLAVGDVVGHGLPAVEDMAQLRSAGRAMALQGLPPSQLLAELNTFTAHASHGRFATMAVAVFDPAAGAISYALAGHPPMLLRRAREGDVVRLVDGCGPVLGPIHDATYTEGQARLEPGDTLVMYTDGLVEATGRHLETGITMAEKLIAGWKPDGPLNAGCRQLTGALVSRPRRDDVCVVIVRFRPVDCHG